MEDGDVWWCFAEVEVIDLYSGDDTTEREQGARMRRVIDRWRNTDINGNRLRLDSMTTKITKVASFQETICEPSGAADLLNRIRAIQSDTHARAARSHEELVLSVGDILDQLHQNDFELLIELIFSSSGWKRISAVGGTQKTLDLAMILPTTGEHCFVQVKSQTSRTTFRKLVDALDNSQGYSRMFFVYHTPAEAFENTAADRVIVWHRYEIARQAVRAGLVDWILSRTT
jgi:restriction endonuclease